MDIYSGIVFGEVIRISADFTQAGASVLVEGPNGWENTGYQVANFRHDSHAALVQVASDQLEEPFDIVDDELCEED